MSATDPLRDALAALIDEIAGPTGRIRLNAEHVHMRDDDDLIAAAIGRAREALAAVPSEPDAWEWRAVYLDTGRAATEPMDNRGMLAFSSRADLTIGCALERRRPGTAPSPWGRVDPEPREED